jgi:carbon-monoxide dehydrogenase medium subunit
MNKKFEYIRAKTPKEACEIKARYGQKARYLAGGTDLLVEWRRGLTEFKYCIDLTFISGLKYIKRTKREWRIGALSTLASLEGASDGSSLMTCMSDVASQMCTPQIRTFATVGGNVSHASPSADLSVLFVALDAEAKIVGVSGERTVAMKDFFKGVNKTVLRKDEMLAEIRIPVSELRVAPSFRRVTRTVIDLAQVNAAVCLRVDAGGVVADARIALGAVAPVPMRSGAAEKMLVGLEASKIKEDLIEKVSRQAASDTKPITDIRGSAAYRRELSKVLVRRSIEESIQKLQGAIS